MNPFGIIILSITVCLITNCFGVSTVIAHPADEQVTIVDIYLTKTTWRAEVRMNGESLFLNLTKDFPNDEEYEVIKNMYHNENISTPDLRPIFLQSFGSYIAFLFDEKPVPCKREYLDDPEYDYIPSMNESLWGMMQASGAIPEKAKTFRLKYPKQLYPLLINIHPADTKAQLSDIFPSGSERPTQPYYLQGKIPQETKKNKNNAFLEKLKKLF